MKRMYIGAALLAVLLTVGIGLTVVFDRIFSPMGELLEQASAAAQAQDDEKAAVFALQAQKKWENARDFAAAVTDHQDIEQLSALFARLRTLSPADEAGEFAAVCAELAVFSRALAESQQLTWRTIL